MLVERDGRNETNERKVNQMPKPKTKELNETQTVILNGIHSAIDILFKRRIAQIEEQLDEARKVADVDKLKIAFPVNIDYGESVPTIKVGITWSQTVRDDIISAVPDPNQGTFEFITVAEAKASSVAADLELNSSGEDE